MLFRSHPESFYGCAALSGALDISARGYKRFLPEWQGIFGFDLKRVEDLKGSKHDVFAIAEKNKADGVKFPKLFMWCGEQDTLIEDNNRFDALLNELDVDHVYRTSEGDHTWRWWDMHIQSALDYLLS